MFWEKISLENKNKIAQNLSDVIPQVDAINDENGAAVANIIL